MRIDSVNRILREQITGIRVVRSFVREPYETERFGVANDELTAVSTSTGRWTATMFPSVMLILNVSIVGLLWFGGHRVDGGAMEIGALTAFMSYLMQILMSVMMATFMLVQVPRSAVCADRIAEVLDTGTSVPRSVDAGDRALAARHARVRRTSSSPIREPASRCCATCRSRHGPARPPR